jgi:hypothetical protein
MKITVQRKLLGGLYIVGIRVSEFSDEDRQKMATFGVPHVNVRWGPPNDQSQGVALLTKLDDTYTAGFVSEREARQYEEKVLADIRAAIESLKKKNDEFTSTDEVTL